MAAQPQQKKAQLAVKAAAAGMMMRMMVPARAAGVMRAVPKMPQMLCRPVVRLLSYDTRQEKRGMATAVTTTSEPKDTALEVQQQNTHTDRQTQTPRDDERAARSPSMPRRSIAVAGPCGWGGWWGGEAVLLVLCC